MKSNIPAIIEDFKRGMAVLQLVYKYHYTRPEIEDIIRQELLNQGG